MTPYSQHSTLDREDLARLSSQVERLKHLMAPSGGWFRLEQLAYLCSASTPGISARLREIRGQGVYNVDRRKVDGIPGLYEYRLVVRRPEQLKLQECA